MCFMLWFQHFSTFQSIKLIVAIFPCHSAAYHPFQMPVLDCLSGCIRGTRFGVLSHSMTMTVPWSNSFNQSYQYCYSIPSYPHLIPINWRILEIYSSFISWSLIFPCQVTERVKSSTAEANSEPRAAGPKDQRWGAPSQRLKEPDPKQRGCRTTKGYQLCLCCALWRSIKRYRIDLKIS